MCEDSCSRARTHTHMRARTTRAHAKVRAHIECARVCAAHAAAHTGRRAQWHSARPQMSSRAHARVLYNARAAAPNRPPAAPRTQSGHNLCATVACPMHGAHAARGWASRCGHRSHSQGTTPYTHAAGSADSTEPPVVRRGRSGDTGVTVYSAHNKRPHDVNPNPHAPHALVLECGKGSPCASIHHSRPSWGTGRLVPPPNSAMWCYVKFARTSARRPHTALRTTPPRTAARAPSLRACAPIAHARGHEVRRTTAHMSRCAHQQPTNAA